jgi:hypothetical protein
MTTSNRFLAAYGTMLAVAALFPFAFIALAVLGLVFLIGPVFSRLYPYFFVGERDVTYDIHRYFDGTSATFLTILHWLVLSAIFALLAKRLRGIALVLAAVFFLFVAGFVTHVICTAVGIQLLVQQPRM